MSFAGRLVHRLALVAPTSTGADDEYGQPVPGEPTVTLVRGLIQPKSAREVALISQAGAEVSDHTVFMLPRLIPAGAYLADADAVGVLAGGRRFDVTGVRSFEFGRSPHLEVDVRLVGSTEGPGVGS